MSSLSDASGRAQARLDLSHVHDAVNSHHLQFAVVMSRLLVLILFLWSPGVGSRAPAASAQFARPTSFSRAARALVRFVSASHGQCKHGRSGGGDRQ